MGWLEALVGWGMAAGFIVFCLVKHVIEWMKKKPYDPDRG